MYIISPNKTQTNNSQWDYKPQSGVTGDQLLSQMDGLATYQATTFSDQKPEYKVYIDNAIEETRMMQDSEDANLGDFFRRPIKVTSIDWGTGLTLAATVNPWTLYFNNPRVVNRISNFNLLRCKLRIKLVVNGNSFQYGRALMAYLPLHTNDAMSTNSALVPNDLIGTSQLPKIFINPSESTGGEMELPFFWHKNYLSVPDAEWTQMGELYFRSLTPLKHANGATDKTTIGVFVWAEDVHLSVLTTVEPSTIVPQSGIEVDKAVKGIVSGPATAIAKFAKAASSIPGIGPYAVATNIAATATAAIATQFGYSKPPNTVDPMPINPRTVSSMALTNVPDACAKLTLDNKQELSIDPRIAGMESVDGMCIKEIAKRESYVTQFTWGTAAATETLLWNCRVSPMMWGSTTTATDPAIHLPACSFAALPFDYWTGTVRLRFQICSSAFHKGRLKFVYDPNFIASIEYNTNHIDIIDLADKTDFTIEVGIAQSQNILRHLYPGRDAVSEAYSTTAYTAVEPASNGVLGVYVVNSLTTPNSTVNNDVLVNVYISCGDDFEVFVPNEEIAYYTFKPQSGFECSLDADDYEVEPSPTCLTGLWIDCFQNDIFECYEFKWSSVFRHCPFKCWRHRYEIDNYLFDPPPLGQIEITEVHDLTPPVISDITDPFSPQSGLIVADSQNTEELDAPQQSLTMQLGLPAQHTQKLNLVFMGESIQSFRTLLKRYNNHRNNGYGSASAQTLTGRHPMFPFYRGNVAGAVDLTATSTPYTYCNTVMLQYVASAFSGWRGSIRWKMCKAGGKQAGQYDTTWVERRNFYDINGYQLFTLNWSGTTAKQFARNGVLFNPPGLQGTGPPSGMNGMCIAHGTVNPNIEFEMPFYNNIRFVPGKPINYTTGSTVPIDSYEWYWSGGGDTFSTVTHFCAAGEDFQTYFFTGCPRIYYVAGTLPA